MAMCSDPQDKSFGSQRSASPSWELWPNKVLLRCWYTSRVGRTLEDRPSPTSNGSCVSIVVRFKQLKASVWTSDPNTVWYFPNGWTASASLWALAVWTELKEMPEVTVKNDNSRVAARLNRSTFPLRQFRLHRVTASTVKTDGSDCIMSQRSSTTRLKRLVYQHLYRGLLGRLSAETVQWAFGQAKCRDCAVSVWAG